MIMVRAIVLFTILASGYAEAASFTLGAVIQAGSASVNELFLGGSSGVSTVAGNVTPYWAEGADTNFSIAYNAATNTATLLAQTGSPSSSISWTVAGGSAGAPDSPSTTWAPCGPYAGKHCCP